MRIHFRVTSPLLALILILIGITRGWALIPMIALAMLVIGVICLVAIGYGVTHPIQVTNEIIEDQKRIHSDYLVVDAHTKEIIRRYNGFNEAKDDIILWGKSIKNGRDFDGKIVYDCYFKHNGFKENGGYAHYDAILYKEYDYYKEMNNND